jgi:hypothetical protein
MIRTQPPMTEEQATHSDDLYRHRFQARTLGMTL